MSKQSPRDRRIRGVILPGSLDGRVVVLHQAD